MKSDKNEKKEEITLYIDPMVGMLTASALRLFLPPILERFHSTDNDGRFAELSGAMYEIVDALEMTSLERLNLKEVFRGEIGKMNWV